MSDDEREPTDAEHVEYVRKTMQEAMDRADFGAASPEDCLNAVGLPQRSITVYAVDLTEIGSFELVPPPHARGWPSWVIATFCRHWVYKDTSGVVHGIGVKKRMELRARGKADIWVMIKHPEGAN